MDMLAFVGWNFEDLKSVRVSETCFFHLLFPFGRRCVKILKFCLRVAVRSDADAESSSSLRDIQTRDYIYFSLSIHYLKFSGSIGWWPIDPVSIELCNLLIISPGNIMTKVNG